MKKFPLLLIILFILAIQGKTQSFVREINVFKEQDKLNPPPKNAIILIGSSSFAMWYNMQEQFPDFIMINRGFGGSTFEDLIRYAEDIVFPYLPGQIVVYCGENDFASSDTISAELVTQRFIRFYDLLAETLPGVKISYVSMKPSPSRWHQSGKFMEGNRNIQVFLESKPNTSFVDIWEDMLNSSGLPDSTLFLDDMLHMNSDGYRIWQMRIRQHLINQR